MFRKLLEKHPDIFRDALHTKMDRLERKLEKLASWYFGKEIIIVYVPPEGIKGAIVVKKEEESGGVKSC